MLISQFTYVYVALYETGFTDIINEENTLILFKNVRFVFAIDLHSLAYIPLRNFTSRPSLLVAFHDML